MPVDPPYKDCFDLPGVCRADWNWQCNPSSIDKTPPTSIKFLPASNYYNTRRWDPGAGQRTVGTISVVEGPHLNRSPDIRLLNSRTLAIFKVYPLTTSLTIGHSSNYAGTNDSLSKLDRSDQSISRPQSPATVHPYGMSTNHCLSIGHSLSSAGTNDDSSKVDKTDRSNSKLQWPAIVHHQGIDQSNSKPQSPAIVHPHGMSTNQCLSIGYSSSSAGTNDTSSKMDKTDRSNSRPQSPAIVLPQGISTNHCPSIDYSSIYAGTKDAASMDQSNSRPQSPAIVHPQGMSTDHCPSIGHSSSSVATNDASNKMDEKDQSNSRPQSPEIVYPQGILSTNLRPYDLPLIKLCRYSWRLEQIIWSRWVKELSEHTQISIKIQIVVTGHRASSRYIH